MGIEKVFREGAFPGGTFNRVVEEARRSDKDRADDGMYGDRIHSSFRPRVPRMRAARLLENVGFFTNYRENGKGYIWAEKEAVVLEANDKKGSGHGDAYMLSSYPDSVGGGQNDDELRMAGTVLLSNLSTVNWYPRGSLVFYMEYQAGLNIILPSSGQIIAFRLEQPEYAYSYWKDENDPKKKRRILPVWYGTRLSWIGTNLRPEDPQPETRKPTDDYRGEIGYRGNQDTAFSSTRQREWDFYADAYNANSTHSTEVMLVDHLGIFQNTLTSNASGKGFAIARPVFSGQRTRVVYEILQLECRTREGGL